MSVFSGEEKVGFNHVAIENKDSIVYVNERSEINITLLGNADTIKTRAEYELKDYSLKSFSFVMRTESENLAAMGRVDGEFMRVELNTPSGNTHIELSAKKDFTVFALLPQLLLEKNIEVGMEYRVLLFEPSAVIMGANEKDLISVNRVQAIETLRSESGGMVEVYRVTTDFMGSHYTTWISADGEVVKQAMPAGLTAIREDKSQAGGGRLSSFDIIEKTSIPSNGKIRRPRETKYMKADIGGIDNLDHTDINDGYSQTIKGGTIEIRKVSISGAGYKLPYINGPEAPLTMPSHLIQSDEEAMVQKAREITENESDPEKAVSKINDWVYENLEKQGTAGLPSALDVLRTKKGDCNEHAVLFAALSRASGIPTKLVMGTIYINGRFYYHAWNEVYLGSWVPVDSTYGQFPADAAHIKLTQGDLKKSAEIMKVVGKIKIEVLEAS